MSKLILFRYAFITLVVCISTIQPAHAGAQKKKLKAYVINIASSKNTFNSGNLPAVKIQGKHRYYHVKLRSGDTIWNRLRLGFFYSKTSATNALKIIQKSNPDAFIGIVDASEIKSSENSEIHRTAYPVEYLLVKTADALLDSASKLNFSLQSVNETQPTVSQPPVEENINEYYVISLKTSSNLNEFDRIINHPAVSQQALYISDLNIDNRIWYQYRLGFFVTKNNAETIYASLKKQFPLARIIRISKQEKQIATSKVRAFTAATSSKKSIPAKTKAPADPRKTYTALIKQGSSALSGKNYTAAIEHFSTLLSYPENSFSRDAQELLGFAYELNKQIAEARNEYERYISLYPESKGALRVKQRLASLITARKPTPKGLRAIKKDSREPEWQFFGSLSQFYRRDTSSFDINTETDTTVIRTTDERVNLSEINTLVNLNARYRGHDYDIRSRFTGGHTEDFKNSDEHSKAPINELYIDVLGFKNQINGRLGRQTTNKGGVFGRFDGLDAGYQLSDWFKLNLTTGFQVPSIYHSADSDAFFTSVRGDFGTFLNAWDFSLYYMKQQQGEIIGREAIGSEFRYFHPKRSLFGLIDHDILFDQTNTFLLTGTWVTDNRVTLNASIDFRQSPLLSVRNALQSQTFESIDEMLQSFSEDQVLQIADDRTAKVKSYIAGISYPLSDSYTLSSDLSSTRISATTASAGVEAFPATGPDYYLNTQLVGTSVFTDNDSNITGLSYSSTDASDTLTLRWNYRVSVQQNLRLNPRLSIAKRDNSNNTSQSIFGAAFKLDYRWGRRTSFEIELGGESSDRTLVTGDEKNKLYFFNLGYQHNF